MFTLFRVAFWSWYYTCMFNNRVVKPAYKGDVGKNWKRAYNREKMDWRLWFSIAAHETGDFKSDLFKRANNCFGMRVPKDRRWFGIGETNGYSKYANIRMSFRDYYEWCVVNKIDWGYWQKPDNTFDLYATIEGWTAQMKMRKYYEASFEDYTAGVYAAYQRALKLVNPGVVLLSVLLVGFTITFLVYRLFFYKKKKR